MPMKGNVAFSRTILLAAIAALTMAMGGRAAAANLVTNPGFESPIDPAWTIEYVFGGPSDFLVKDRATVAEHSGDYGLYFRNMHDGTMHAYARQVVTGLTPGASYAVSVWMKHVWDRTDVYDVYMEALGGSASQTSPASTATYAQYTLAQTADSSGKVEIRLHFNKFSDTTDYEIAEGYFDDVSLAPVPEPGSLAALLAGFVGLGSVLRRRTK
jgi:hypothetical protein